MHEPENLPQLNLGLSLRNSILKNEILYCLKLKALHFYFSTLKKKHSEYQFWYIWTKLRLSNSIYIICYFTLNIQGWQNRDLKQKIIFDFVKFLLELTLILSGIKSYLLYARWGRGDIYAPSMISRKKMFWPIPLAHTNNYPK